MLLKSADIQYDVNLKYNGSPVIELLRVFFVSHLNKIDRMTVTELLVLSQFCICIHLECLLKTNQEIHKYIQAVNK